MEFDKDFFAEQERSGFVVSADMKKVWAVELELFEKFSAVCEKHNLPFHLSGGSLLGAVRHGGFIPWDDDIDIMMLREDYNKLCSIANDEFSKPYFFQTHYTDTGYTRAHAQIRKDGTTGILKSEKDCFSFHQGIFIDVFPMDNIPDDAKKLSKMQKKIGFCRKLLGLTCDYAANEPKSAVKNLAHKILSFLLNPDKIYDKLEKASQAYNGEKTARVAPVSAFPFVDKMFFPRECYDEIVSVPFENITAPIPKDYDTLLTIQYGDYMVQRKDNSYHGGIIFDTEKDYREYLK